MASFSPQQRGNFRRSPNGLQDLFRCFCGCPEGPTATLDESLAYAKIQRQHLALANFNFRLHVTAVVIT